jgi:cytochrome c oxidase assembly protein subunit 17
MSSSSESTSSTVAVEKPKPFLGKSGKKICCACPETRKPRDACVVEKGEEFCRDLIDAHDSCLRLDGFTVPVKPWTLNR